MARTLHLAWPALLFLGAAAPAPPTTCPPSVLTAVAQDDDAAEALQELRDEYDQAYQAYSTARRSAETDEERLAARKLMPVADVWAARFMALAEQHPRTDVAAEALLWAVEKTRSLTGKEALALLIANHSKSEVMAKVVVRLTLSDENIAILRRLDTESPHRNVRAQSGYALATLLQSRADKSEDEETAARDRQEVETILENILETYADVAGRSKTLGEYATAKLFELRHLQVGQVAPDILAEDIDGVGFKLSDYRGKVVLLDFWGHW